MKIWDISEPITEDTAVFPGDTPFSREWVMRMEKGHSSNVSTIRLSPHCGSHADAPVHYDSDLEGIGTRDLDLYLGRCRVMAIAGRGDPALIPAAELRSRDLSGVERLLLRTRPLHDHTRFDPTFTALGPEAAEAVVAAGIRLIGIDTQSMDHATSKELPAHQILKAGDVALLENLDLTDVPQGDYELIALPLKIMGGDASPVRAILRGPL